MMLIALYLAIMFVISGTIFLRANKDTGFYGHVFHWWISPLIILAGIVFIEKGRKKQYFQRVRSNLFIKK